MRVWPCNLCRLRLRVCISVLRRLGNRLLLLFLCRQLRQGGRGDRFDEGWGVESGQQELQPPGDGCRVKRKPERLREKAEGSKSVKRH